MQKNESEKQIEGEKPVLSGVEGNPVFHPFFALIITELRLILLHPNFVPVRF